MTLQLVLKQPLCLNANRKVLWFYPNGDVDTETHTQQ